MTAAAPSPSEGRRPLGEVLVERGIVTPEQLTTALEQQRATGQPLGEIIVGFGFAPGPIIAQALATQKGSLIKTEYGFATGWSSDAPPTPVAAATPAAKSELADRDRLIAELHAWAESAQAAIASRDEAIARLSAQLAGQDRAPDSAANDVAHEEALEALRAELADQSDAHASTQAELEAQVAALASRDDTVEQLRAELETVRGDLAAQVAEHAAEIAQSEAAHATAEYELTAARSTSSELERRLQNARSRAETLARRVAEQDKELETLRAPAQPTREVDRWASAPMHYLLRRAAGGYDLVEHQGPPPTVGDTVDGLRVARVASAGAAFDVPCVYLAD
jgi:hypothetical protein